MNKSIHIISGGTVQHIATHLALCAPAYGRTGRVLERMCKEIIPKLDVHLHETRMASGHNTGLETNEDVDTLIDFITANPATKIVFMPVALCDFKVDKAMSFSDYGVSHVGVGKNYPRFSSKLEYELSLVPASKIIQKIRAHRKDIFLVGFKTTDGMYADEQYRAGLNLLKEASCNLVLANDVKTKLNMVITPEEARYHETTDREAALRGLVEMAKLRSHLTFTRSTVVAGEPVPWDSPLVPEALRKVVDHCIEQGAYKPFRGATVGHFACKLDDTTFLTSQRKTNFNDLAKIGLVKIKTDGPDTVLAYGAKPSVGGQSQRIIFKDHPEYDCIVHFHCPLRTTALCANHGLADCPKCGSYAVMATGIPTVSQREYECGSHQCGQNTSSGLKKLGNLACVMLDQHGPNIVFHHSIDPQEVIDFIDANFDLKGKTGGYV